MGARLVLPIQIIFVHTVMEILGDAKQTYFAGLFNKLLMFIVGGVHRTAESASQGKDKRLENQTWRETGQESRGAYW